LAEHAVHQILKSFSGSNYLHKGRNVHWNGLYQGMRYHDSLLDNPTPLVLRVPSTAYFVDPVGELGILLNPDVAELKRRTHTCRHHRL
jgi:hypothetical protein